MNRRGFLMTAGVCAGAAFAQQPAQVAAAAARVKKRIKLGISTYSYWNFEEKKPTVEAIIERAGDLGVECVDILHRNLDMDELTPMDAAGRAYCRRLKRLAFGKGIAVACLSTHQNFVSPDEKRRQHQVEHTLRCLDVADALGAGCVRVNAGRWGTVRKFEDYLERRALEPTLEGRTDDDAFGWAIESLGKCLKRAEELGIPLALENHWGLTRSPEGVMRILDALKSPFIRALMDTGNFLEDPYDKLKTIAPATIFVQAKTYIGGGRWYSVDLDYARIAGILADVGYGGYVSLEMEGKEPPDKAVPKSIEMLRRAFGV